MQSRFPVPRSMTEAELKELFSESISRWPSSTPTVVMISCMKEAMTQKLYVILNSVKFSKSMYRLRRAVLRQHKPIKSFCCVSSRKNVYTKCSVDARCALLPVLEFLLFAVADCVLAANVVQPHRVRILTRERERERAGRAQTCGSAK